MSETTLNLSQLKELIKTAIAQEQPEVFSDILVEAMEKVALVKAIEAGESTEIVDREAKLTH